MMDLPYLDPDLDLSWTCWSCFCFYSYWSSPAHVPGQHSPSTLTTSPPTVGSYSLTKLHPASTFPGSSLSSSHSHRFRPVGDWCDDDWYDDRLRHYDLHFIIWYSSWSFMILLVRLLLVSYWSFPSHVPGLVRPQHPAPWFMLLLPPVLLFPLQPAPLKPPPSPGSEKSFCSSSPPSSSLTLQLGALLLLCLNVQSLYTN